MRARVCLFTLALGACQQAPLPFPSGRLVDLSHPYDSLTIYWPTDTLGFRLERLFEGVTERGYFYAANRFATAEHGGTHLDAPIHFAQGGWRADEIPLDRLLGPAVLIDVSDSCAQNRDYQVQVADLQAWERAHGRIPDGAIVLLRTGMGRFWPDRTRYLGTALRGPEALARLSFPGLHPEAAQWLVRERAIKAIGIDTPSIDYGRSEDFQSHRILAARNIPAFENVANLEALPPKGAYVVALPMKIRGGSGGPLRILAIVPP
ncbi:MAG: cyclase family protein [Bacteroidetes bacterium]|nr:cyclase family protein [Rhodothermia bacterium]MCS7154735.1 cyclase family protein [Bacteroidota bacterium]MCX7907108.1 cyclase family protein [Bacteroidota bacterium]MDW8137528.1 cyclase family protein [Bacteroidota bacterium]MDW8285518.1 cyclase family protein [Bacteroidota bacterium]